MDKFEKTARSALYFLFSANLIMAIGLAILGYALNEALPYYASGIVFLAGFAVIYIIKNAIKKYKTMIEQEKK